MQPEFPGDEGSPAPSDVAAELPGPAAPQAQVPAGQLTVPPGELTGTPGELTGTPGELTVPGGRRAGPGGRRTGSAGWRIVLALGALVIGLAGLAVSAAGAAGQLLPRRFSVAEQQQIMTWQTARRWRIRSAGQIFPATVSYQLPGYSLSSGSGLTLTARRVGIARQAACQAATDPAAARVLDQRGCTAVLRATYIDSTGSLVVTIGVAVLPSPAAAGAVAAALPHSGRPVAGVRAAPFAQTLASRFGDSQRQLSWAVSDGPYLIMSVAGYADGRPRVPLSSDSYAGQEMTSAADGVAEAVAMPLGAQPVAPRCPGAPGC
jgi:hypothetical protein